MAKMSIFDPAMCCSTGVCGPSIDTELLRVSSVLSNLEKNGVKVERYNLANNPQAFVDDKTINEMLNEEGVDVLPVTMVDGKVVKTKDYPANDEFIKLLDVPESYLNVSGKVKIKGCGCKGGCC
jgi:hypothetical protein